ncbi:benzyl alcohol O-benzoyltransferase-like [Senna tora]|uniref:Benzyl alcohol O-benzoyltransferase-like n=1 Tax=Senna tora TaxID=362788 RepID=A0A835C5Z7_9FABA|nr:benzyl alcohol O-benzoyltransferase-like [Senna tora]
MNQSSPSDLVFTVKRRQPELVAPAKPTPREFKLLSDIDDQDGFRLQIPLVHFYPSHPSMVGKDPAHVIKTALAHALVFYYPFAGRLREGHARKLMVDCSAQGVLFVEADADVTLSQFGHLQPPFPCFQQLLYKVPSSEGMIDCPLLHIQVTRLKCGGFIFALQMNHTMCDGPGVVQFLKALAKIARGASEPSIQPVWLRKLLNARDPPRVTCTHYEYQQVAVPPHDDIEETQDMVQRSFFFGPTQIAAIRQSLPHHLRDGCTKFELLTAFLWRCRTIALQLEPIDAVRLMCVINARGKKTLGGLEIPEGYYGNAIVFPAVVTTAGKLIGENNSIGYALEIVKRIKSEMSEEYVQSVADLMVIRGRPCFTKARSWIVSNLEHVGFRDVDFGWGKAVFAGIAKAGAGGFPGVSFYVSCENAEGEEGIVICICLPSKAMERFVKEMDGMLEKPFMHSSL